VWPPDGIDITYALEPTELGCWPTNVSAGVEIRFDRGDPQQKVFPIPTVCVGQPPTATPALPTPTATALPTPRPYPIFLPAAWRKHCQPSATGWDVALVVDTSSSMLIEGADGLPRAEWVMYAASSAVDALDYDLDTASIIAVAEQSTVLSMLSTDRGALQTELSRMFSTMADTSVLAPALSDAATVLRSGEQLSDGRSAILLFTDGYSDIAAADAAAAEVLSGGIPIFAFGIGSDLDTESLAGIAGSADRINLSINGADLPAHAAELIGRMHCGPDNLP
jgi:hypothetical protein